jgi:predicted RNA-binding protein associated with RNAse of E/G family
MCRPQTCLPCPAPHIQGKTNYEKYKKGGLPDRPPFFSFDSEGSKLWKGASFLGRANEYYIKSYQAETIRVDEKDIAGYASLLKIEEINRPFMAGVICLYNKGYSELCFLPDGENWTLFAIYNDKDEIVEWYIDITKKNALDEDGNPYCDDLYIDAVLMPDGTLLILDEDDLKNALDRGDISNADFELAYRVLYELKNKGILNTAYMSTLCARLKLLF